MTTTYFNDRNDYIARLSNLPVPGANSRLINRTSAATAPTTINASGSADPFTVAKQWQAALIAERYLYTTRYHRSDNENNDNNNNNPAGTDSCCFVLQGERDSSHRRIVQLKLSLLPSAPITNVDISLPPVQYGGEVDVFWPSNDNTTFTTCVVDETSLVLPVVPPLKMPAKQTSEKRRDAARLDTGNENVENDDGDYGGNVVVDGDDENDDDEVPIDKLIQQQWIEPVVAKCLRANIMKLHRLVALKGGIQNKRWGFEAEAFLSSLPDEDWDIVVEKSFLPSSSIAGSSPGVVNATSQSASRFGVGNDVMKFISSATSAFEDYVYGTNASNNNNNSSNNKNNNNNNNNNQQQQQQQQRSVVSNSATPTASASNNNNNNNNIVNNFGGAGMNTLAIHLRIALFTKSRSSENRQRLLKAISKIMKHATEQMKGGEVRDQLEALTTPSASSTHLFSPDQQQEERGSFLSHGLSHQNENESDDTDADHHPHRRPRQQNSRERYDVKSDFSCVIHVSEAISNEYSFAAIQNQRVLFDIVRSGDDSDCQQNNGDKNFRNRQALRMLNQVIFEELFLINHQSSSSSSSSSPLPKAVKEDFSFCDFIPSLEHAIISCVERVANWCTILYGFSVTFGSCLWNRPRSQSGSLSAALARPPCFSNSAVFLFETPRSDETSPVISLFIQITATNRSQPASSSSLSSSSRHSSTPCGDALFMPQVNIISAQLERNGQPLMFSWLPPSENTFSSENFYESIAGAVLQYLVDSIPKLQGLYRSMLHHHHHHQHQLQHQHETHMKPQ